MIPVIISDMEKEINQLSRVAVPELHETELKDLLIYLNARSPFYKDVFAKNNIDISEIKDISHLTKIPPTTKEDIQARNWDFLCVPTDEIVEYCSTSGTMGLPTIIALTKGDLDRLAYNEYLSFLSAETTEKDIFQLMLTLDRQFMAGISYYYGAHKTGAGVVRVGPGNLAMQIDTIQRIKSTVLVAVPSFIINVINYASEKNIDLNATSVKKIICIGENIRDEDFSLNELGKRIVKNWNVELYSTYASTEMQTAFTECRYGIGGHHHTELLMFEVLDEDNNQLPPGEYGELTITTLGVKGMPLLRYKTGDICTYYDEKCSCGKTSYRISPIKARKHQLIKYNGTTLYPQTILNLLNGIEEIADYVVWVSKNDIGTEDMQIFVALQQTDEPVNDKIKQLLQSALRVLPKITYLPLPDIQNMKIIEGKRKISKLVDCR
jgi:phenylacetate-CoA ligase